MNVLICDSDSVHAEYCKSLLHNIAEKNRLDIEIVLLTSGRQLLFYKDTKFSDVDLIYLDYNIKDVGTLEMAKNLRRNNIQADIVFATFDRQKAIEGYEVDALDFIIKNETSTEKYERIFLKAAERTKIRRETFLSLACNGERRKIAVDSILYFEIYKRVATVHYGDNQTFVFYSSLSRLEEVLANKGFVRIHQSYLVSEKHIHKKTVQTVEMGDGRLLPVGRSYQKKLSKL